MVWPPPKRGEPVRLGCGCTAAVVITLPIAFVCWIRVDTVASNCRRWHRPGSRRVARLEDMEPPAREDAARLMK